MVGLAAWVGLTALNLAGFRVQYVLLLAVIAGVTELIPLVGPVIGAVPAVIIALFDSPTTALAVLALYILIQQLENSLLVPRIVGESVGIHPAVLMIVLVLCTQVLGFFWIILAAPIAAVLRDVFRYVHGRLSDPPRPAGLLPDEPLPIHASPPPPQPEAAPAASHPPAIEQQRPFRNSDD
jgi:predicted PurR-regulated permease PerM